MKKIFWLSITLAAMTMVSCKNNNKGADAAAAAAADAAAAVENTVEDISDEALDALEDVQVELNEEETKLLDDLNFINKDLTIDELANKAAEELAANAPINYVLVAEKPTFKGGDPNKFSKWVNNRINYPEAAKEAGEEGTVFVQFVVDEEGNVTDVQTVKSSGSETLDAEAVRVVSASPKWTAGQQNGNPVKVSYTFPVQFRLNN